MPSSHVKPGDLITADFFNSLLDRLEALEAQGGPAGMLTITALEPATGPYRVGTQLIVRGTNFDFSVGTWPLANISVRMLLTGQSSPGNKPLSEQIFASTMSGGRTKSVCSWLSFFKAFTNVSS